MHRILILALALCPSLTAQTIGQSWRYQTVVYAGNSLAQFQGQIAQQDELSLLAPGRVLVHGHDSLTCEDILPIITYDVFGGGINPSVVLMFNSTSDVIHGTPVTEFATCLQQTLYTLLARKPSLTILVANTPPMAQDNCYGDLRQQIAIYNEYIANVVSQIGGAELLDVWTPAADADGWAKDGWMTGVCGVHYGPADTWAGGWVLASPQWSQAIYAALEAKR